MRAPPCSSMHAHSLHNITPPFPTHSSLSIICLSTTSDRWPTPYSDKCILVRCSGFREVKIRLPYVSVRNAATKTTTHAMFFVFQVRCLLVRRGALSVCVRSHLVCDPACRPTRSVGRTKKLTDNSRTKTTPTPSHGHSNLHTSSQTLSSYKHCAESD